jgi:hypothetical protein
MPEADDIVQRIVITGEDDVLAAFAKIGKAAEDLGKELGAAAAAVSPAQWEAFGAGLVSARHSGVIRCDALKRRREHRRGPGDRVRGSQNNGAPDWPAEGTLPHARRVKPRGRPVHTRKRLRGVQLL